MMLLRAAWAYRHFIANAIRNEFRVRFARSKLGGLWMVIHPLLQALIFALVLSNILAAKLPGVTDKYAYAVYLLAGTLGWSLFAETISRLTGLFVEYGNMMKKIAFPRICLPLIAVGITLTTNLFLLVAILAVFAALGHMPPATAGWLPLLLLATLLLSTGIGLVTGVVNVFLRDVGQVVPIFLQLFFWLTPIVYSREMLPERIRPLFALNPLQPLIASYQNVLLYGTPPDFAGLARVAAMGVVLMALGLVMFRRASPDMVDML